MVMFQVTIIVLNVALNIHSHFGTVLLIEEGRQLNPLLMNLVISNGFLGAMYLTSMCLSIRLLLMYISRALALYLGCIHRNLDQCLRSRSTPESRKVLLVDHMRVQLALLKNCVDLASSLLGPSLLYAYAYSVAILCAAAYYTIIPELEFRVRLFFFFFGSLHWLSVLLPTITTHRMKAAVIELRSAVQGVSMANYSDDLLAQLRMMLNSMKHDDLRFTGCGFFVVDLSTFADIMGAVITYTVVQHRSVLVQHLQLLLAGVAKLLHPQLRRALRGCCLLTLQYLQAVSSPWSVSSSCASRPMSCVSKGAPPLQSSAWKKPSLSDI
ncbi:hypothetical protein MRX96_033613 [Rhipicephalus microplus]